MSFNPIQTYKDDIEVKHNVMPMQLLAETRYISFAGMCMNVFKKRTAFKPAEFQILCVCAGVPAPWSVFLHLNHVVQGIYSQFIRYACTI